MAKTTFFKSSLGVFQGGGCRAAAFVGAYEEAIRRGVSFTELAGTSAGSIVAALIGAGASPTDLREAVKELNFASFMTRPERIGARGILGKIVSLKYPKIADLYFDQGFHSSKLIKTWMNEQLVKFLPQEKRPITFSSLPFPTYIVSTDLGRSEAKIWSQNTTPNELVADAVEASCAIPLFFQPAGRRHVDGGVISNLPAFVFFDNTNTHRPLASRILAFTLIADVEQEDTWSTESFFRLLANAIVEGAQEIQLSLQSSVHVIRIPTGNITATDFGKMTPTIVQSLIDSGVSAARTFFDEELIRVRPSTADASVCHGLDEVYTRVTESLEVPLERVVISDYNTDWVYSLFPSLACWRTKGVPVEVILPIRTDRADEPFRRKLLRAMGAHIWEVDEIPVRSFVMLSRDSTQNRAIVGVRKRSQSQTIDAVLYEGFLNDIAIRAVLRQLDDIITVTVKGPTERPRFQRDLRGDLLFKRIKEVGQYSKAGISVTFETVPIDRLVSLTRFVREYKYRQIKHFIDLYKQVELPIFQPAIIRLIEGKASIVTPPVVEEAGHQFILVEGSTRATYCRDEGIENLECIVVRGVKDPLPSDSISFNRVRVIGRTLAPDKRYEKFNYAHFRSIERAVHPLDSLD